MASKCFLLISSFFVLFIAYGWYRLEFDVDEELNFTIVNFTNKYGYDLEEHKIQTEDNFTIVLHRIKSKTPYQENKHVVAFLGGFGCSPEMHVLLGPKHDYSFSLVDAGFDVWIVNPRGTRYFTPNDPYAVYSFYEQGVYDVPASIDFILNYKNETQLSFICQSLGCSALAITLSLKPNYNQNVRKALLLGSVFNAYRTCTVISEIFSFITRKMRWFGDNFLYTMFPLRIEWANNCDHPYLNWLCIWIIRDGFKYGGPLDMKVFGLVLRNAALAPMYGFLEHQFQNYIRGELAQWDYGKEENLRIYGSEISPRIPIEKITTPFRVYFTEDDDFIDAEHLLRGLSESRSLTGVYRVSLPFTHTHFVINGNQNKDIINDIIESLVIR